MHKQFQTWIGHVALVTAAVMAAAVHAGPPALSSNPANLAIFPAKGQTPEQQRADESAAYDWATQQTRWDPYEAKAAIDQQGQSASAAADSARGGAIKGGADVSPCRPRHEGVDAACSSLASRRGDQTRHGARGRRGLDSVWCRARPEWEHGAHGRRPDDPLSGRRWRGVVRVWPCLAGARGSTAS